MDLIFFGMQGSGKGTLGKNIAARFGLEIFETGAELRKLSKEDSPLAQKVKSIIESGNLVPNEVVMEIVENFMENLTPGTSILFDGIPRKIEQAQSLNALLEKHGHQYTAVLLEIKKETALSRLTSRRICPNDKLVYPKDYKKDSCEKCGGQLITRADDVPEAIETRLNHFFEQTVPAIELYKEKMIILNGEASIDEVKQEAITTLTPLF